MIYAIYLPRKGGVEPETLIDTFYIDDPSEMEDFTTMRERLMNSHDTIIIVATKSVGDDE